MLVGIFALPAYAQTTIKGTIQFDPGNTNGIGSVTGMTIHVAGPDGFVGNTSPNADGTFSIAVPANGTYSISVTPSRLDYVNKTTNVNYSIFYPDGVSMAFWRIVPDQVANGTSIPALYTSYPTISGTIAFDPNNYENVTSVTQMTIYARNASGFDTKVNPNADGTFTMNVVGNGTYSFWVIPDKLSYFNKSTKSVYTIQYPNGADVKFTQSVPDAGLKGVVIPATTTNATTLPSIPPTITPFAPTPKPSPGFALLGAFAAIGAAAAIAFRKR